MGKALSAVRMVLSTLVGAIAGGLIPLSTATPPEPTLPPSGPPPMVEPRAQQLTLVRPPALRQPPAATPVPQLPQPAHRASQFAHRPVSAIRPASYEPNVFPAKLPPVQRTEVAVKADVPATALAPGSSCAKRPRHRCALLRRLGRGLFRHRSCRWR